MVSVSTFQGAGPEPIQKAQDHFDEWKLTMFDFETLYNEPTMAKLDEATTLLRSHDAQQRCEGQAAITEMVLALANAAHMVELRSYRRPSGFPSLDELQRFESMAFKRIDGQPAASEFDALSDAHIEACISGLRSAIISLQPADHG